jgi:hypothetical protein
VGGSDFLRLVELPYWIRSNNHLRLTDNLESNAPPRQSGVVILITLARSMKKTYTFATAPESSGSRELITSD